MPWAEPPPLKPQLVAWGLLQTFFGRFELCNEETFTWCFTRHNTQQNFYRPIAHQTLWTPVNCHYSQSNVAQFVNHWVVCGHCKLAHAPTSNVTVYPHTLEQTFTSLQNTAKLNCRRSVNAKLSGQNLFTVVMPSNEHEGQCLICLQIKQMIKAKLSPWTDLPQIVCLVSFKKEMKGSNE